MSGIISMVCYYPDHSMMSFNMRSVIIFLTLIFVYGTSCNGAPTTSSGNLYLGTEKVSRDQAVQLCEDRSMELVSIQNADKNEALFHLLKENGIDYAVWTSGHKNTDGKTWTWLKGEEIKYFNWGPGEPNEARGNESCIEVFKKNSEVLWNDQPCGDKRGFICAAKKITEKFYVGTDKVSRDEAEQLCEDRSMDLVSIQTPEKNEVIFHLLRANGIAYPVWTSGHKNSDGKTWTWLDGEVITYFNWGPGEPNEARGNESCMEVSKKESEVMWNDQPCGDKRGFICEPKKITENFYVETEKVSRDQAEQMCEERSMKLVSIHNSEINKALFHLLQANGIDYPVWTSGHKNSDGKTWTWLDGEEARYFNWGPGEPNEARGNESCIEVFKKNSEVFWNDHPCGDKRGFICEKKDECETKLISVTVDGKVCSQTTEALSTPRKKFYISTQKATRPQAVKHCSDMYMQLATLRNEEENSGLFKLMHAKETSTPYWISGNKEPKGSWEWKNNDPITYFNWGKGEPNYKGADNICIEAFTSGEALFWNDQYCSSERFFVCEKLNPVVRIAVKGNLTISHGFGISEENACTVVVNSK